MTSSLRPKRIDSTIVLAGLMGSGKSTVARELGERLGLPVIDTDLELEREEGRSLQEIFETDGEAYFRDCERKIVVKAITSPGARVVALGGGAFVDPECRSVCVGRPAVNSVYLRASPEVLFARLASTDLTRRPLLQNDPIARLRELLSVRRSAYEQADFAVDVESLNPSEVADRILEHLHG